MPHLLCLGYGFSARAIAKAARARGWTVSGTTRSEAKLAALAADGVRGVLFSAAAPVPGRVWETVTHVVSSIAPVSDDPVSGDPALARCRGALEGAAAVGWIGYLSTTGVYGDHGGAWVDEDTAIAPRAARSKRRAAAERAWLATNPRAHVFRLAGIYGPGRSAVEALRNGTARRVVKPGQVFCRIHVQDIAQAVMASIDAPAPGRVYNVCDDEPAPGQEVIAYAAALTGIEPPPEIAVDAADLSPMARSFYAENRRVRNQRIKAELGVVLKYPTYREGLRGCL